jgi:hypothetical protein
MYHFASVLLSSFSGENNPSVVIQILDFQKRTNNYIALIQTNNNQNLMKRIRRKKLFTSIGRNPIVDKYTSYIDYTSYQPFPVLRLG